MKRSKGLFGEVWEAISSVRLGVVLIALVAVASTIGTIVPPPPHGYDVYGAPWFIALLAIFAVNLLACTLRRLPRTWRQVIRLNPERRREELEALAWKRTFAADVGLPFVEQYLKDAGYACRVSQSCLVAQKGRLRRFGYVIVHLGILVILSGGLVSHLSAIKGDLSILIGEKVDGFERFDTGAVHPFGFSLHVHDFSVEYHESGMPIDYRCEVEVLDADGTSRDTTIRVNYPLRHKGFTFYQSSYGAGPVVRVTDPASDEVVAEGVVPVGEELIWGSASGTVRLVVADFQPDFRLGPDGVSSASNELRNPAIQVALSLPGEHKPRWFWVFRDHEMPHPVEVPYTVQLTDVRNPAFTVLSVANDPGVPFVVAGIIVLVLGTVVCFLITYRRYWVLADKGGVLVAGSSPPDGALLRRLGPERAAP